MLGLGFWEIVVIVLIALVVVGPERLPSFARSIGRFLNDIKRTASGLKSSLDQGEDVFAGNLDGLQKKDSVKPSSSIKQQDSSVLGKEDLPSDPGKKDNSSENV